MTDINAESAATTDAGAAPPGPPGLDPFGPGKAPRRASRAMRNPLLRIAAAVTGLALGWGTFQVASNLWASRNDNTPVSSSSHAPSGALRVSGHGVTVTFPRGWVNVPLTPNDFAAFLRLSAAEFPQLRAAAKSQLENMQNVRSLAVLAYRIGRGGAVTASTNVLILPTAVPPSQLMPHLNGAVAQFGATHQHDSLTAFGQYAAVLVTYTLPSVAGRPAGYGAQAYLHGPSSTPVITVTTTTAGDATAILRQIASTFRFS